MSEIEVFTLGETMVVFQPEQMQSLEYVQQFPKRIGGAETNVAIGLSRLGHRVGWFSKLGEDSFGQYVYKSVRGEGVETSSCIFTDQAATGVLFKEQLSPEDMNVYYYRKGSAASLMEPGDLDEAYIAQAKILHITGITPALSDACYRTVMEAIRIAKKHGLTIVFDPNLRLKLWTAEKAKRILNEIAMHADVILPGLDEGQFMTGKEKIEDVAESLNDGKDKTIIVKIGSKGAYVHTREEQFIVDGFPISQIMDPVGAGDGFAAGIISGILKQDSLKQTVKRANAIGAMVMKVKGDFEGLPNSAAVEDFIDPVNEWKDIKR
ncbi:sugar kinase [Planococcus sp. CPCC 101016]|uniref:sugar kinase n=1 Tax=Planococcus sp. CPCC 101016 TaxID=2599617 RepID=UPI0011B7DA11|nr:sugar kinase [Planococcus sp. CPCC 101016]TWT05281.1 sugar kinase [Planococcus sp. CPCC 101016]